MLKGIKAVIFDLDGTLIDSMWMWKQIDIEYLQSFQIPLPNDLQSKIEGMSFSETAIYFKERFKLADDLDTIKATWNAMAYSKYQNEVLLKEGVLDFLKYLKQQGIKTGIATSNSRELVDVAIRGLEIETYFDAIHTSCEAKKGKPSPDIYLLVSSKLEVLPEDCLVFEDIPQGIIAGKSAGMKVCAVHDDFSKDLEQEKRTLADYFIQTYRELKVTNL